MLAKSLRIIPATAAAILLAACASDGGSGGLFSTASVVPPAIEAPAAKAKVDPQCVTLASQIDTLRKEGTIERLEKVAAGKGDKVQVKRTAIAKQAELNKANAEFQVKCASRIPAAQEAAAPAAAAKPIATAAAATAAPAVAKAAAKAAPAAATGVTVVPSQPKVQ
jgi:mRNA-degrading endonuclease toxin of MazEF toxin-antitoxin module